MTERSNQRNRWTLALSAALLLSLAVRAVFFVISVSRVPPTMDESLTMLQAKSIVESKGSEAAQAKLYPRPPLNRFPLLFFTQPYLFPLESYLQAPWVLWLPRTALGARLLPAVLGFASLVLMWRTLRRQGSEDDLWPGLLLVAWPSSYLVMLQHAYAPPSYGSALFFLALLLWLIQRRYEAGAEATALSAAGLGLLAGLACSGQLMMAPFLLASALGVATTGSVRSRSYALLTFGLGAALGLLPHWLGIWYYPGAHQAATLRVPWKAALARLWTPVLTFTLPSAFGIRCPRFSDGQSAIRLVPGLERLFPYVWLAILTAATAQVLRRRIRTRCGGSVADLVPGIAALGIALFVVNRRAESHAFRYLAPVAAVFPWTVADLYRQGGRWVRRVVGAVAGAWALFNAATLITLLRDWSQPGFAAEEARLYDLWPAIRYLEQRGIRHAVASYFDAYRLTYMTDERILCAQHYNDRFYGWPLPYKTAVDASTNVAYVLGPAYRFSFTDFENDLRIMGVTCRVEVCGTVRVYTDFRWEPPYPEIPLAREMWKPFPDVQPSQAGHLHDGNPFTRWRSHRAQQPGLGIDLRLKETAAVNRVTLYYDGYPYDQTRVFRVLSRGGDSWSVVTSPVSAALDRFEFRNGHPIYGSQAQTVRFPPVRTDTLRLEIVEPNPGRDWTIGEIALFLAPEVVVHGETGAPGGVGEE